MSLKTAIIRRSLAGLMCLGCPAVSHAAAINGDFEAKVVLQQDGSSAGLPLSITVIFGISHVPDASGVLQHTLKNPNAPSALTYAWIGPFVGALVRPVGGWLSDKTGGSIVTQIISAVMVVASASVGYVMWLAYQSASPEQYFLTFMLLFVLLFTASGIGNGSTFRTIAVIFDRQHAGPVLGWTSAIAAYGAFIAPVVIGQQIKAGTPEVAMYGFAIFYALCLVLNWWFYLRAGAEIRNPGNCLKRGRE